MTVLGLVFLALASALSILRACYLPALKQAYGQAIAAGCHEQHTKAHRGDRMALTWEGIIASIVFFIVVPILIYFLNRKKKGLGWMLLLMIIAIIVLMNM